MIRFASRHPAFVCIAALALMDACSGSDPTELPGEGEIPTQDATIVVQPGIVHQTIIGWEGSDEAGEVTQEDLIEQYQDELFDQVVNELGLNRIRLHVQSGAQNPVDWFTSYKNGKIPNDEWRRRRYEISEERTYHWSKIDFWVEHAIEPMRRELAARGEDLYVNLCYVNFETQVPNQIYHHWDHPAAYGAFMAAAFRHLDDRYGWVPDAVEVILEPDNVNGWTGARIGAAIVHAGDSLRAAGYEPDFIAPSNKDMGAAIEYFDELISVPRVTEYLTDIAYHRYGGVSRSNLEQIATRARQHNLRTAMLEHIGSGYRDLHEDLEVGLNSAWQQHVIAFPNVPDNGGNFFIIETSVGAVPRVVPGLRNRFLKLYFRYVRRNAVRIGATTQNDDLDPLAFRNSDGGFVVVVKADEAASFSVGGLPAGTYGIRYSTEDENDQDPGRQTIAAGQDLSTSIPGEGVLTIFRD